ncbi:mitochondrial ribonuclease P catalytic subunit isoform X2 [Procambarus clarkii]|nr:mitochondrial ribonuclease P catalytic subunit-like [Procambarus clarkii]
MALRQYLQNGKLILSASKRHGCSLQTCHMVKCHPSINTLNMSFSVKRFITHFSSQLFSRTVVLRNFLEMQRCSYSNISGINCSSKELDDFDNGEGENHKSNAQLDDIFINKAQMSSTEWEDVIDLASHLKYQISEKSCDAIMMGKCQTHCNYLLANSYLDHIERRGREPNLATLGTYLQLCGEAVDQCGEEKVLEVYQKLTSQVKMLDSSLSKKAILGLTSTREWKHSFKHLSVIKKMANICNATYSAIIAAAFRNNDYDTGYQYLEAMWSDEKVPNDKVFLEFIKQCAAVESTEEKITMTQTLFHKLAIFDIFPRLLVIQEIDVLYRKSLGWFSNYVEIHKRGRCPACGSQLEGLAVDEEEFKHLQEEFVPRVLHKSDIYLSSSPREWADFRDFVEEHEPFSTVVDGLNVAYVCGFDKSPSIRVKVLRNVVDEVLRQNPHGRILVIGREHMKRWSREGIFMNKKGVSFYTLNNMSRDDGFFIYAALQSGFGTNFITNDLLRDHLFRLGQVSLRDTFRRWQRMHQIKIVSLRTGVRLLAPPSFSTTAQCGVNGGWHIPYDDGKPRESYQLPQTWLCLQSAPPGKKLKSSQLDKVYDNKVRHSDWKINIDKYKNTNQPKAKKTLMKDMRLEHLKRALSRQTEIGIVNERTKPYPARKTTGKKRITDFQSSTIRNVFNDDDDK